MNENKNNASEKLHLYIAHVGFYDPNIGMYELHSNILVVAPDMVAAKQAVKQKEIFINKKMHIDGIQEISNVDGHQITISKQDFAIQENKTYGYDEVKYLATTEMSEWKKTIEYFGGIPELSRALQITTKAIYQWQKIPLKRTLQIEKMTKGSIKSEKLAEEKIKN